MGGRKTYFRVWEKSPVPFDAEFAAVIQTHVFGAFALTREAGRRMIERKSGSILFIASMASLMGIPLVVAYSAAKSAYVGMVHSLATEWGQHGVRVNAIAPGWIASAMLDKALSGDAARKTKILGRTPTTSAGRRFIYAARRQNLSPE